MKVNWGKVFTKVKQGLAVAGQFDPRIAAIDAAIESVQASIPDNPGADKKATVEAVSDALVSTELLHLDAAQQAQFKALRSTYIDLAVREKQAIADAMASREALTAFVQSFKKVEGV